MTKGPNPSLAELTLFFAGMPKGGDIHHHYSGSIYAESYLDWVEKKGCWINKETFKIEKQQSDLGITVQTLRDNPELYRGLLRLWSSKDYSNHYHVQSAPDHQFFSTFGYFGPIADADYREGLRVLKERAVRENVQYIETMFSSVKYEQRDSDLDSFFYRCRNNRDEKEMQKLLARMVSTMENDGRFHVAVEEHVDLVRESHEGIDDALFTMRFQTYVTRNNPPSVVFSGLYAAFKAASRSRLIVGVNIVGPEDGIVSIRDYWLHMQMFRFLRTVFPDVHVSMHAGELTIGMVKPEDLVHHVRDAVYIAGTDRVGHGVDLPYENGSIELLRFMSLKEKAVEINLTSNEFILGVKNSAHPITLYQKQHVPIVISTDDAGVSRNNLTQEYVLAASRYRLSYAEIKQFVYNSIRYSFMTELDKQRNMKVLDHKFRAFEAEIAGLVTQGE